VGGATLILIALLFGGLFAGTDVAAPPTAPNAGATKLAKLAVALIHVVLHVAIATLVLWAVVRLVGDHPLLIWLLGAVALFAAGSAIGSTLFAAVLLAIHRVRGEHAREAANQVFTGQSIPDYKNLLRMRFARDGSLTIYPLGVERACRDWRYAGADAAGSRFVPGGAPPVAHAIDEPLRYDAAGRRVA
jgi:hypothetical protein